MIDVEDEGIVVTDPYNPVRRIRYRLFDRIKKHDLHHNTDMDIHILKENVIFIKQATY